MFQGKCCIYMYILNFYYLQKEKMDFELLPLILSKGKHILKGRWKCNKNLKNQINIREQHNLKHTVNACT